MTDCTCDECVHLCHWAPGWMTPDEARAAMAAGQGGKLMQDFLTPSTKLGNTEDIDVLCPAVDGYEGERAPYGSFGTGVGRCTFLVNERCAIHASGFKPKQCREAMGCKAGTGPTKYDIARLWNNEEAQALVEQWRHLHNV